jgi:hypothetical protein
VAGSRKIEADVVVKVTGADDVEDVAAAVRELSDTTSTVRVEVEGEEQVKKLSREFDDLDNVTVTATAKVTNQKDIQEFISNVRGLDGETATAVLAVRAGQAQDDLRSLIVQIADVNSTEAEVRVATDQLPAVKADLDALSTAIREIDAQTVNVDTSGASQSLRNIGESARVGGEAVSNAIGNASQDLLGMAGVSGTASQAIGQLAESFVDASRGAGSMGQAFADVGKAAAPIALVVATVSALGSIFSAIEAEAKQAADATDLLTGAMSKGGDASLQIADALRSNVKGLQNFDALSRTAWGGFLEGATAAANAIPLIGSLIPDDAFQNISDVAKAFNDAGISAYQLGTALQKGGVDVTALQVQLELLAKTGKITADQASAASQAIGVYADAAEKAKESQALFNVDIGEANALLAAQADPLSKNTDLWQTLFDDIADGTVDSQAAADAINQLAAATGKTQEEVVALAKEHLDDEMKANAEAAEEAAKAQEEAAKALADYTVKVLDAQSALDGLTGDFSILESRSSALSSIFDLGNAPLDALGDIQDVEQGIRDFAEFLKTDLKGKVPDIFNPDDVNADDFLAKIESLRGPIQQQIADAFGAGGPEAAQQVADNYVDQIVKALGGKLTREQVVALLNLGDLQAKIDVALDQSKLDLAKRSLAILTGLQGESPWTASIGLALETGQITPETAQVLINQKLAGAGVEIPATLQTPDAGQATVAAAQWSKEHPVELATTVDGTGAVTGTEGVVKTIEKTGATIFLDADPKQAESEAQGFRTATDKSKTTVNVDATTAAATAILLAFLSAPRATTVYVGTSGVPEVDRTLDALAAPRRAPIEAYLSDYPTAAEIAAKIGRPRIPVDIVVGQSIRITGVRD